MIRDDVPYVSSMALDINPVLECDVNLSISLSSVF